MIEAIESHSGQNNLEIERCLVKNHKIKEVDLLKTKQISLNIIQPTLKSVSKLMQTKISFSFKLYLSLLYEGVFQHFQDTLTVYPLS